MAEETAKEIQITDPFRFLVDSALSIEGIRVATQVRQTHLTLKNRRDVETDELLKKLIDLESYADGRMATLLKNHPAYDWFSKIKGVGKENVAKVLGPIDIKKAPSISSLWKYCGMHVVDGKAPRPIPGKKLDHNKQLRSMCWRLGVSLMKGKGKFFDYYIGEKAKYVEKYRNTGVKIIPAAQLPVKDGKKYEPDGIISTGHVHNQALRKMIKLFLGCLWLVWREKEGLPTRPPYAIEKLGHQTLISPWEMTDRKP